MLINAFGIRLEEFDMKNSSHMIDHDVNCVLIH